MSLDPDVEHCYPSLVSAAGKLIRRDELLSHREDEAGDLVNEVVLALLEKYGPSMGYNPAKGTLGAYLNGCICEHWRRTAKRSWRKRLHRETPTDPLPELAGEHTPASESDRRLKELLNDVEVDPLLEAHHLGGHSWDEIAVATDTQPATLRQRASRSAKKVRETVTSRELEAESE
jgi:RNA polymerase sigma factor (sigma-70 family)